MIASEMDEIVPEFSTYNDYLDSMLTKEDLMFLQDKEMCRELLTLGYHSNKKIISEEEFNRKKAEITKDISEKKVKEIKLCGAGEVCNEVLMQALAKREEDNLTGRKALAFRSLFSRGKTGYLACDKNALYLKTLANNVKSLVPQKCMDKMNFSFHKADKVTIIFLRCKNSKDEEVSSYIDYAHRLKTENWEDYFIGKKKLVPHANDLSFYNWSKEESFYTSSPNFEVIPDNDALKLYFLCKKDGKTVDVNPKIQKREEEEEEDDDPVIHDLNVTDYLQAVLFDHMIERSVP